MGALVVGYLVVLGAVVGVLVLYLLYLLYLLYFQLCPILLCDLSPLVCVEHSEHMFAWLLIVLRDRCGGIRAILVVPVVPVVPFVPVVPVPSVPFVPFVPVALVVLPAPSRPPL